MQRPQTAPPTGRPGLMMLGHGGLQRRPTGRITGKKFVVAVDGSRLGFRAVRLAAWLMDEHTKDKIQCVSATKGISASEALELIKSGEDLLKQSGLRPMSILPGRVLNLEGGKSLAETISSAASGGHLVMGAGGARLQAEAANRKSSAAAAMGSVAQQCMSVCKAPVIIAKPKAVPKLDSTKFLEDRRGGAGMVIIVTVDGSSIAQKSFDMMLRFVHPGDEVHCVFVSTTDEKAVRPGAANALLGNSAVRTYYKQECARAGDRFSQASFEFTSVPLKKASVTDTLIGFVEEKVADLVILGSVELAKATGEALGSVSAAVAKKTDANVLISKHFA